MNKHFDINQPGHSIRCKLYYNELRAIRRLVIFGHGFGGHKDNKAAERYAEKVLAKYKNTAVLVFDWPSHGEDVKKKLTLEDCMTYITHVVNYARESLGAEELYVYATSFGGYLFLLYLQKYGNPFEKLAFRCPAVNMYETLTRSVMQSADADKLRKGKDAEVGFDRKIKIGQAFLNELQENDIQKLDYLDFAENILILHGTKDEIVPFDAVQKFAEENLIEFLPVEKADHRFQDPRIMDGAIQQINRFFEFGN